MSLRPALWLAFALGLGAFVGPSVPAEALRLALPLAGASLLVLLLTPGRVRRVAPTALPVLAAVLGASGAVVDRETLERHPLRVALGEPEEFPVRVEGCLRGEPSGSAGQLRIVMEALEIRALNGRQLPPGRIRLQIGGTAPIPTLEDGDRVATWARLRAPRARPGGRASSSLQRQGLVATGNVESALLLEREKGGRQCATFPGISGLRNGASRLIDRHVVPGVERGLVKAMLVGDRSGIDEETAEAFRRAGTYHVLALSGAQVALVAGLVLLALRRASPTLRVVALLPVVGLYAALAGGDAPVLRASLMVAAVGLGRVFDLDADTPNMIGVAALILLSVDPLAIRDPGLQLSFVATMALVVGTRPMLRGWPRWPLRLEVGVAASLVIQAALWPLSALLFHRLGLLAPLTNLLAVPLSSAVQLCGVGVVLTGGLVPSVAGLAGNVAWVAAHALRLSCGPAVVMEAADFRVATPSPMLVLVAVAGFAALSRGRRVVGGFLTLAGLLAAVAGLPGAPADGRLHLTLLDVGQGDAIVLRSPRGKVLLIDAGGGWAGWDAGERVVAPYLWDLGVVHLDRIVVSHFHSDHAGGVPFLLEAFAVGEVWEGARAKREAAFACTREALAARPGTMAFCPRVESRFEWDGLEIEVIGPQGPRSGADRARNEDSLVLRVSLDQVALVFTGDGGQSAGFGSHGRRWLLKVPHHGSRRAPWGGPPPGLTAPRIALVSVGRNNRFGHPAPEVLERYTSAGALVLRTDRDGTIEIATDGRRLFWRVESEEWMRELH